MGDDKTKLIIRTEKSYKTKKNHGCRVGRMAQWQDEAIPPPLPKPSGRHCEDPPAGGDEATLNRIRKLHCQSSLLTFLCQNL